MTDIEILESTYFDVCNIKRHEKVKDPATGISSVKDVVVATNLKCALSKKDSQTLNQSQVGSLNYSHLLFINPTVDIREGDTIEVTCFEVKDTFIASKPFRYSSHKEVYLSLKERV